MSQPITPEEKASAFDALAEALTNRWADGRWSWWCRTPPGGEMRDARDEAIADLVLWAERTAKINRVRFSKPLAETQGYPSPLPIVDGQFRMDGWTQTETGIVGGIPLPKS